MDFDSALDFIRKAVKYSAVENQKHIDPALVAAEEREKLQMALFVVQSAVDEGKLTQDELKTKLGLI